MAVLVSSLWTSSLWVGLGWILRLGDVRGEPAWAVAHPGPYSGASCDHWNPSLAPAPLCCQPREPPARGGRCSLFEFLPGRKLLPVSVSSGGHLFSCAESATWYVRRIRKVLETGPTLATATTGRGGWGPFLEFGCPETSGACP